MAKRIALIGFHLESNAFAVPTGPEDFRRLCYLEGDALTAEARKANPFCPLEVPGFFAEMDRLAPGWIPVPILCMAAEPGGPIEQEFFDACLAKIEGLMRQAGPVDGAYISNHGAMTATETFDPDGELYAAVRRCVGPVPVVASVDLHANISHAMVDAVDAFVSYRTNPHVDQRERGAECARHLAELMAGAKTHTALVRLPLAPASVNLLTASGPYADLMDAAEARMGEDKRLMNLSVVGGFVLGDTPKNGIALVATSRASKAHAHATAEEFAARAWADRQRFVKKLTPIAHALDLAREAMAGKRKPVIFADSGDNPGGGGRGCTTELLLAMLDGGISNALFGCFVDAALAQEAIEKGAGAEFVARFNRVGADKFGVAFERKARVVSIHPGKVVGRRGIYMGRQVDLGPNAALDLGGVTVVVQSKRKQCADPIFFEMHGLDIAKAACVGVKSRGHFRAGFDEFFPPENVFEIDTAGLTAPVLERLDFKNLPRPVFPLDAHASWTPQGSVTPASR
jgi:microcystin degradation protein MlrC